MSSVHSSDAGGSVRSLNSQEQPPQPLGKDNPGYDQDSGLVKRRVSGGSSQDLNQLELQQQQQQRVSSVPNDLLDEEEQSQQRKKRKFDIVYHTGAFGNLAAYIFDGVSIPGTNCTPREYKLLLLLRIYHRNGDKMNKQSAFFQLL